MSASPERGPDLSMPAWNGPLAPLSIAAYVTWLAVASQPLAPYLRGLKALDTRGAAASLALLAMLLLFVLRACSGDPPLRLRRQQALVLAQALCALLAIWALPDAGAMPVLLILVAAQVSILFTPAQALAVLLVANAVLADVLIARWPLAPALGALFSYFGFQAFATLTTTYARRAVEARDALARLNAELLATRRLLMESTRGEERLRLSRELHDVAGHKLTALKLQLRLQVQSAAAETQQEALRDCMRLSDELLADIRGVVDTLRAHDGIDLQAALTALVPSLPQPQVRLELEPALRVAGLDQAQALLRCAQEGLTNALRHSGAARVVLRLQARDQGIELQVEDDGAARSLPVPGNGLTGMRERLVALGGRLELELLPAGGLRLRAWLPPGNAA